MMGKYVAEFAKGTVSGALIGLFCGFVGFGLIALLLHLSGVPESGLTIALNGAKVFGILGLLSGGPASCLHLVGKRGKGSEEPSL